MSNPICEGKLRDILAHLLGQKLLDISEHDPEDLAEGKDSFVELMFDGGHTLKFNVADADSYVSGYPFCFSDPHPKPEDDDGLWHPTREESNSGAWAVVEHLTDKGPVNHMLPTSEPLHALDEGCWCGPQRTPEGIVHNLKE